jgi:hypothetical protein
MGRHRVAVIGLAWLAAGCLGYDGGSFRYLGFYEFPSDRATVGCLDVGIEPARTSTVRRPVVSVVVGNRCERAVPVHWARLVGRGSEVQPGSGSGWHALAVARAPWATSRELAANWSVHEILPLDQPGKTRELDEVCIDVARLVDTASGEQWVCIPTTGAS